MVKYRLIIFDPWRLHLLDQYFIRYIYKGGFEIVKIKSIYCIGFFNYWKDVLGGGSTKGCS